VVGIEVVGQSQIGDWTVVQQGFLDVLVGDHVLLPDQIGLVLLKLLFVLLVLHRQFEHVLDVFLYEAHSFHLVVIVGLERLGLVVEVGSQI